MPKIFLRRIDCLQKSGDSGADDLFLKIYVDGQSSFSRWPNSGSVNIRTGSHRYIDMEFDFERSLRIVARDNDPVGGDDTVSTFDIAADAPVSGWVTDTVASGASYSLEYLFITEPIKTLRILAVHCAKESHLINRATFEAVINGAQAACLAAAAGFGSAPIPGGRAIAGGFLEATKVLKRIEDVGEWILENVDAVDKVYMTHVDPARGLGGGFFPPNDSEDRYHEMNKNDTVVFEDQYGGYARFPLDRGIRIQLREYDLIFNDVLVGALDIAADHPADGPAHMVVACDYYENQGQGHGALYYLCYSVGMDDWRLPPPHSELPPLVAEPISGGERKDGRLEYGHLGITEPDHYGVWYHLVVEEEAQYRISAVTHGNLSFLMLILGAAPDFTNPPILASDQGWETQVVRTLRPGTYSLVLESRDENRGGEFSLAVSDPRSVFDATQIAFGVEVSGYLDSTAISQFFGVGNYYAKWYQFTVLVEGTYLIQATHRFFNIRIGPVEGISFAGRYLGTLQNIAPSSSYTLTLRPGVHSLEITSMEPHTSGEFSFTIGPA